MRPIRLLAIATVLAGGALVVPAIQSAQALPAGLSLAADVHHDSSQPLSRMAMPSHFVPGHISIEPQRAHQTRSTAVSDPVLQSSATIAARAKVVHNYVGMGVEYGKGYAPGAVPPDTVGAVGAKQYVQWVNSDLLVLDKKTGATQLGPIAGNSLWKGFGGECEKENDGDPVVNYDRFAHRWLLQQFAITNGYYECVAVSKTEDATGAYNRYAFKYKGFPDYPKAGVWSHSYVATFNMSSGESGAKVCAWDRKAMLAGRAAREVCFNQTNDFSLLPADADGTRAPGATEDIPLATQTTAETAAMGIYTMHIDWSRPSASRISNLAVVHTADYTIACVGYGIASRISSACIPQPGPSGVGLAGPLGLDALSDRLMFRLAWRKFADGHEAMVVTQSVDAAPVTSALRWYELGRKGGAGAWSVKQQGSYAPDLDSRWMGSGAMDKNGGIAIGYSVSGAATFPSIRIAGRTAKDPAGQLSKETAIASGFGEQSTASYIARWGDYSAMTVDPVDDCTFWYTTEYMTTVGIFSWSTRVAAVKLPGC